MWAALYAALVLGAYALGYRQGRSDEQFQRS